MVDIDHFKSINDRFGHPIGDKVLATMSQRAVKLMRPHDVFARYGGEEFLALMPETGVDSAMQAAERLRRELALAGNDGLPAITVSIGLCEWSAKDVTAESLVQRADGALYAAKSNGRNQVALAPAWGTDSTDKQSRTSHAPACVKTELDVHHQPSAQQENQIEIRSQQ